MQFLKTTALAILFLLINSFLQAQNVVTVKNGLLENYLGKNVYLYQDTSNKLNFEQIRQSARLFKPNSLDVPNLGISQFNNWVKFKLVNNSPLDKVILEISNPIIDEANLYMITNQGIDSIKYSNFRPLSEREYKHQFYLFDVPIKKGDTIDCYLKLKSNQQILAPLSMETEKSIVSEISESDTRAGIYLGIMLIMLFYNLFIYFTTRDSDYLYYCHYIFWVALTQATLLGYSHRFLWTDNVWMARNMIIFCGAMSGIATILFSKAFLRTRKLVPRLDIAMNIVITSYVISILILFFGNKADAFQLVNASAALGSILIIFVAWAVYRKNFISAKYFLISWSIFFTSIIIFVFKDYNIVPYNMYTVHSVEIGSALEAVFLSFALAAKINILKKEKEASQAEVLVTLQENERIVREQNVILETKVTERTHELNKSNQELNVTLDDLKQTQTQLVESEKMASLGQLTAGIAHEINNPINFVTSNINPLKRDVEMILDAMNTIENVGMSDASPDEKKKQIEEYKEEVDFDYLIVEIRHLIKGIYEGASRTAEIVKGLKIFSRLDEDDLKRADINEGLQSTMVIANNLLNGKINVVTEYGELPLVESYAGKLNQVFLNIISNAIYAVNKRFGDEPGGEIKIATTCDDKNAVITITDNGTGMNDQTMKKIFEPFFTTKDVGEGTGLGMSIAYNTIKKHNGQIAVNSELGKGTEFILKIPIIFDTKIV
ncbi:MAG TPA: 7TM diverse intracellular signaling domain-containing protein [Mucilaginibacter sp.]|jgi:signal transduction histidine kinase|nr:7TM diverse intracellular signaling domain-containing protein [Mucilaginibacter sp.]